MKRLTRVSKSRVPCQKRNEIILYDINLYDIVLYDIMSNFKKLVIEPLRKTNPVTVLEIGRAHV